MLGRHPSRFSRGAARCGTLSRRAGAALNAVTSGSGRPVFAVTNGRCTSVGTRRTRRRDERRFCVQRVALRDARIRFTSGLIPLSIQRSISACWAGVRNVSVPVAVSNFPDDVVYSARSWAEQAYPNLVHFNDVDRGGHFAAWEQPELYASEVRAGLRSLR